MYADIRWRFICVARISRIWHAQRRNALFCYLHISLFIFLELKSDTFFSAELRWLALPCSLNQPTSLLIQKLGRLVRLLPTKSVSKYQTSRCFAKPSISFLTIYHVLNPSALSQNSRDFNFSVVNRLFGILQPTNHRISPTGLPCGCMHQPLSTPLPHRYCRCFFFDEPKCSQISKRLLLNMLKGPWMRSETPWNLFMNHSIL